MTISISVESEYKELEKQWNTEKVALQGAQSVKSHLEQARIDMEAARRAGDLERASELQYGIIPQLEKQLAVASRAETVEMELLRNKVTDEEIAEIVSKWTGIPVAKMLEGEKDKLLAMEDMLHRRVVSVKTLP